MYSCLVQESDYVGLLSLCFKLCSYFFVVYYFGFLVAYRKTVHNRIQKIGSAEKDSGAAAKLFMTFCTPRLALPKNITLELMRILLFLGLETIPCTYNNIHVAG